MKGQTEVAILPEVQVHRRIITMIITDKGLVEVGATEEEEVPRAAVAVLLPVVRVHQQAVVHRQVAAVLQVVVLHPVVAVRVPVAVQVHRQVVAAVTVADDNSVKTQNLCNTIYNQI